MAFRLDIGQYYAVRSPIHALDARVKLCCALALLVAVFLSHAPAQLVASVVVAAGLTALSHVPAGRILASVKPLLVVLAFLSLFNLVFVQTGAPLLAAGPLHITTGGAWAAVLYTVRFACALVMGSLILLTTTPTQLSDALDRLLAPLSHVGLPGHELAMVFSLMLRFVPTLADEASSIMDAQALRGGSLDEGGPVRRVRAIVPVVVALLAAGLRHADGLSQALDARCYEGGAARTHLHQQRIGARDLVAAALAATAVTVLVLLG